MPKRTTELLDVFRTAGARSGSDKGRAKAGRKSGGRTRTSRKSDRSGTKSSPGFDGVFLNPRQLLLAACVTALLVVLAFTVGIGVGRRGAPPEGGLALARTTGPSTTATWWIRGKVPRRDQLAREPVDPEEVLADLVHLHGFRPSDLVIDEADSPPDYWWIYYGPFPTEEQARLVSQRHNLAYKRVQGSYPFAYAKVVQRAP